MEKVKTVKNDRNPPLFTGKLLIKFQNILRKTTEVVIRHRVKILFSVISSPITLGAIIGVLLQLNQYLSRFSGPLLINTMLFAKKITLLKVS
jgi:hypothetical protein